MDRDRVSGAMMTRCFKDKTPSSTGRNRCECWVMVMFSLRVAAARTNLSAHCISQQPQWNHASPVLSAPRIVPRNKLKSAESEHFRPQRSHWKRKTDESSSFGGGNKGALRVFSS